MFQVPFRSGAPWTLQDEVQHRNVVVLGAKLAAQLFPAGDALGHDVTMEAGSFRVVGVTEPWNPQPHFYQPRGNAFGQGEEFFVPFTVAIDHQFDMDSIWCRQQVSAGWAGRLEPGCAFVQFWVELPDAASVRAYRQFLINYSADQQKSGPVRLAAAGAAEQCPEVAAG